MKKTISTILIAGFVGLTIAMFGYVEYVATGTDNFPYFHLGCLIVGGLVVISLKHKYEKMYLSEAIGFFAFYTVLVVLLTSPVTGFIKSIVG